MVFPKNINVQMVDIKFGQYSQFAFLNTLSKTFAKNVFSYTDLKTFCTSINHHAGNEDDRTTLQQMSDFGISC